MKQNLLFNQASAIGKRIAMVLTMLLIVGIGQAWGESIEINTTNSGVNGSYRDYEFDVSSITFGCTQWMKNNNIQAKKSTTNSCYNVDAIPGIITSIVVKQTGTARAIKIYGGTSSKPTTQITSPTTAAEMTFNFTGKNYTYFSLTTPGNACYFDKITINYTPSGGGGDTGDDNTGGGSDDGECRWELVTDASKLKEGDEIVIAAKDYNYALSTTQNNNNRGQASITKEGNTITWSSGVQIITLGSGVSYNGTFVFNTGSGYLYAAGANSNNYLKTSPNTIANGDWEIAITNNIACITAQGTASRNILRYNTSGLFSCYAENNTQKDIVIYKKTCITETAPTLTASKSSLAFGDVTVNSSKSLTFTLSGSDLTANATLALSGTNASMFTVSPNSVNQSSGSINNQTITVTYTPTSKGNHSATLTISSTGADDITVPLTGTGIAQTANYTIEHYQQNLDGTYPSTPTHTETKSGEVGTQVTPAVKSYTGFNAPATQTVTIKSDGSTVVTYQYTRNSYTLTWDVNEGNALTGSYTSGSVKYGAAITKPADPTREGHVFKGWHNGTSIVTPATTMPASNLTYTAQWTPIYTITWLANGQEFHKQENAVKGTVLDVPDSELDAANYACDDKVFVGWTATPISGTTDDEPVDLFTTKTAKVEDAATTYYAVFATEDGGGAPEETTLTIPYETLTADLTSSYSTKNFTYGGFTFEINACVQSSYCQMRDNAILSYIYIPELPGAITKIATSNCKNASGSSYTGTLRLKTTKTRGNSETDDIEAITYSSVNSFSWSLSNETYKTGYLFTSAGLRIKDLSITYTTSGGTSYSDYSTVCEAIPDPVWGGAVINRNSIKVDCGSMTKLNAADPNGPATISFPAATNHTLTYDITVTASEGFLVSTNKTDAAKYGASVTVSPNKTGDNAGKITQNVYVVAVAPAMSDEDFTGTITLSGKQLAENQLIDVTADVTCTTYTLTLDDRGTKTTAEYYAGASVPKPADPEGVCTDPINYVFDGWSLDPVTDENTTSYEKVTFPFDMPAGKTTLYAVYRYLEGGGNGDYNLVTSALDDWSGDYLIASSDQIFANGTTGGESGIGAKNNKVDLSSYISGSTIPATEGDKYKVILEAVTGGYVLKTQDGKYNYHTNNTGNGISASTIGYADDYPITVKFVSQEEINLCLGGSAIGSVFRYNAQGFFRFYKNGGQNPVYLYKKADGTTYYTTSPVCGPHLAITEGKDIYVTGGNAGGTRDLVIAQQKVSYKATRLQTSNGLADGTAPDVKVATNGITMGGVVTSDVKVTIDQTKEQQTDGTYTITGTITVQYQPSANNKQEDIQVQLAVDYNTDAKDNFTVHARSLPAEFVIVAKQGDKWYALNGDMANGSSANPANGQVTLNDDANPTQATYAPCNTIYTFDGVPNTGDRTRVRFQGTDGAWLWAASGTNVGIQNKSLKDTPEGDNKAYNWRLETEDNITYKFHNDNSSRLLGLSGAKFGMYASGVQDIRILPYIEKCLYNYAPSNLKVSVLKGSYVTLTWDAVAGATKYQYSTNGTTWTDAGTDPTVTINELEGDTEYTYCIRAYHEDAGVSQECIDYAEITFTTADCDDVPTDISFAAGIYSITLYWQCAAETSTVILYSDEAGTQAIKTITDAKSPLTIDDLDKVTTYYAKILAGGTCASPLTTVSTAPPAVDVVEWKTDGMDVYVNTDDEIIVSLEGEVHEGSGSGNVATELFFSKYFEATGNVKLLALFNGTGQDIDLSTYSIKFSAKGADYTGATTTEEVKYDNTIELSEDIPDDRLILPAGKELIMISYPTSGAAGAVSITNPDGTTIKIDSKDAAILECAANNSQESGWDDYVRVTSPLLNFSGNDAVALFKGDQLVDIIGAGNTTNVNMSKVVAASTNPSFMDAAGWYNANGYQIQPDGTIGTTNNYPLSTNRCLLIRRNTVINGDNAVLKNTTDFVTLGGQESEWMGYQIPDGNGACEGFEYVGKYDYANYYTTYDKVGEDQTFESGSRNPDGTVPVSIPEIGKYSCKNLKITVKDEEQVLVVQEFKVPIIVAKNQNTDGEVFTALKTTLGTVVIDQNGTPTGEIEPLTDEEWIEECKECDIVVRDNATLTHVTTGLDQFRDLTIYPTGKLSNIESNLAVNRLMIQAENDQVGYAIIEKGEGSITANAIAHTKRIDAQYWYAFSLPYDCNINEITQANGESMGEYGVHWGIQYYDGKRRQYEGTSANLGQSSKFWLPMGPNDKLNAYQGYLIALFDASVQKPTDMRTIYFPPAEENTYTESGSDSKQTNVYSWNVNLTCEKRHHGWNFTGTPYISMFNPVAAGITDADLSNVLMTGTWDPVENEYEENEHVYVSIPTPNGGKYYNQHLASTKELLPFMAYFVQTSDPTTGDETKQLTYAKGGRELPAAAPARAAATAQRVLVELLVTAPDGQTDNTGVWVDENYVPEYELAADLTKMYVAGEKPQLYTLAANNEKMAYNALPDGAATNIPLGLYAPIAGDYNLSLNERMSRIAGAESVELIYNNAVVANLLFQDYTITAKKGNVNGYSLCIRRRANVTTAVDNVTGSVITMIVNDGYISVLGVPTDATVYVYDMVGHLMEMQSANGNTVVNMPSVPQGVYNIVITNDKGSTTIKSFVK